MNDFSEEDAFEAAAIPLSQRAMARPAMSAEPSNHLDWLNDAQLEAVKKVEGPILVLAGAGTGKTRTLVSRIAEILHQQRARQDEILAVTFTNKAAREMKERVAQYPVGVTDGMRWLGTFHSVCVKQLRRHAELISLDEGKKQGRLRDEEMDVVDESDSTHDAYDLGPVPLPNGQQRLDSTNLGHSRNELHLKSNFTILDTDDQIRLMKQLIEAAGIDTKRWPPRMLAGIIDAWKNKAWTPDKVPASDSAAFDHQGVPLYIAYQKRLLELNAVDFGDILLHMVTIFQTHPDILQQYQRWFRYILVDEYQDTNVAQYLWLRLLAQGHKNICCVGDDDQSIYGWRGAEVGNILRFETDFPGAHVVRLEENYRSTPHILAAASGVIAGNEKRLGKTLFTNFKEGKKVRLTGYWDGDEEARSIGEKIEAHWNGSSEESKNRQNPRLRFFGQELDRRAKDGLGPISEQEYIREVFETGKVYRDLKARNLVSALLKGEPGAENMLKSILPSKDDRFSLEEIAILVRASHQMRAFEDRFLSIGLPYRVIGGPRFYERMEIRDAMAYFRLAVSHDDDLAFERVVNTPKRGLGEKAVQTIQRTARENNVSLVEGARIVCQNRLLGGKGLKELTIFVQSLDRWQQTVYAATTPLIDDDAVLDDGFATAAPAYDHIALAEMILDESGYTGYWQNDKTPEAPGRLENLKELVKALENFDNLQGFLEHVSLIMENETEEQGEKVSIMTLHAAKGLEFPVVFLPGWEEGLFPSQRSMDESGLKGLEEERRLAYVGITRAEEVCAISFASNRRVYGQWQSQLPSRFVDELPPKHVDVLTPSGLSSGAGMVASDLHEKAHSADVYNSPGWKRLQTRGQKPNTPRAQNVTIDATAESAFTQGDRVFHQKFGYGHVDGIEGDKLVITFDKAGTKHVVARFIVSADAADDVPF